MPYRWSPLSRLATAARPTRRAAVLCSPLLLRAPPRPRLAKALPPIPPVVAVPAPRPGASRRLLARSSSAGPPTTGATRRTRRPYHPPPPQPVPPLQTLVRASVGPVLLCSQTPPPRESLPRGNPPSPGSTLRADRALDRGRQPLSNWRTRERP